MSSSATRRALTVALFAISLVCLAPHALSQGGAPAVPAAGRNVPGFVFVPGGQVWPGCTDKEYEARHVGNSDLRKFLKFDVWGQIPPFPLPAFQIGKYEVTNAQWKYYLDTELRVEHTTVKGDTLRSLAGQYVKFRGAPIESEWIAIYALNWRTIVDGWKNMKVRAKKAGKADGEAKPEEDAKPDEEKKEADEGPATPVWQPNWPIESPPTTPPDDISTKELPPGLKLYIYRTRVPQNWYGWCRLSGFQIGREYCDPAKPAAEAFVVPAEEPFKSLALADTDFAAYPVRSASPNEILAFVEWTGCQLPTEYEWERAARGNNLRWAYPFGAWDHDKQKTILAGSENERCRTGGPMRVDDPSVAGSDSPFGARHMAGNVWELTRTFYDVHPRQVLALAGPPALVNYALVAKGGSFGDRWQLLMVCARTGVIGENGVLSLRDNNRVDSLGLRLARHDDRPGLDLLLHSILRLSYDAAAGDWTTYPPHAFATERMAGVDDVKLEEVGAPYIHATKRAHAIAFAPLWVTDLDDAAKRAKPERNKHYVLGALRSDVPLKVGVRLSDAEMRALLDERARYKKIVEEYKKLTPAKKKNVQLPEPPKDMEPDDYEKATEKNMEIWGLFREKTVAPGEWLVVYWNGFIGLANRTRTMPPDAIVLVDPKQITRKNAQPKPAEISLAAGRIQLHFQVWEQPSDKSKQVVPPDPQHSEDWAMCEAYPPYFIKGGANARPYCWDVDVAFPVASDDPAWKGLLPDAVTGHAEEKKADKADGKADASEKTPAGK